jgi:hypothetical protein
VVRRLGYSDTWSLVTPFLRARMRPSGLEVQAMQPGPGGESEPVEGCGWVLSEGALADLVILAGCYQNESDDVKERVRDQLARILRGDVQGKGEG